jgi:hypothetical protein
MATFAQDLISLILFLMPGFVSAWVFYSLTSFAKPSQFERLIQAFIFTLMIQVAADIIIGILLWIGNYWQVGYWSQERSTALSLLLGISLGLIASYLVNSDMLHRFLRDRKITKQTSFPSEWYGTFHKNMTFIVLHLNDERRLYGWPIEWPSDPSKGHFLIADPSWQCEDGAELRIVGAKHLLLDVTEVKWVEFINMDEEKENGEESIESTTAK